MGTVIKKRLAALDKALWGLAIVTVGVAVLSGVGLTMTRVSADGAGSSRAAVTVTSSCQLEQQIDTAHEANVAASTYRENIGKTTFTVTCNDANGYDIYAAGYTNTEFGRNDLLGQDTGRTIGTGTATSGDTSNWAMKLTSVTGTVAPTIATGYNAYHAVPDDYVKVASYASSTMADPVGSQFETTYATYVSSTQVADTYVGKVRYTLVHPSDAASAPCAGTYTISYSANGGSGSMEGQTACVDRSIALLPSGFTPPTPVDDHQFVVWNTEADGSGYTYLALQSVTNLASSGETVTLYAQWAPKYIQDLTRSVCSVATTEGPLTVYDRRDGNTYTVRYLQGACWMTQNLRITGTINKQFSNFSTYDNVNVCEGDLTAGNSHDQPRCHDSGNTTNGVWYNYAAASAKTILTNSNDTVATEDICPAGWHLPSYDTTNPAGSINSMVGVSSTVVSAFAPVTGGFYSSGSPYNTSYGYLWSTGANDSARRYSLHYIGSGLGPSDSSRLSGLYVRCTR